MIRDYMINMGYSDRDIDKIISHDKINGYKDNDLLIKIKDLFNCLLEQGFSYNEIKEMSVMYPVIFTYSIDNICYKMDNIALLGYEKKIVMKMIRRCPKLFGYSIETLKEKQNNLISKGYNYEEMIKLTSSLPPILGLSIENIDRRILDLINLGYGRKDIVKMSLYLPAILIIDINSIYNRINEMEEIGYGKEDVISMSLTFPQVYSLDINNIKDKINKLMELGYSYDEVKQMTLSLPTLFGLSIDNIKRKKDFYDSICLSRLMVVDPKKMMQGMDLSYARYMFFKDMGIDVNMSNYRMLFDSQKKFEKRYGKSNKMIIDLYGYDKNATKGNRLV